MNNNLRKGLITIFSANIINLIFNILTNFLLPKYLSVEAYAKIKTFQLYTTYVGIFSLGYADGMYLRYGGKKIEDIDKSELRVGMFSFRIMMIIESFIIIPIAYLYGDMVILGFCFTILSMNMTSYFKNLYQAVGEFKLYSKILNLTTILTFLANMSLLFILNTDNYLLYLISYILVDTVIWLILEYNIKKLIKEKNEKVDFSFSIIYGDIKSGFTLMIGNFSNILLSSMDRWFVKIMMSTSQFAYYSFAVTMEGFLNVAVTPITVTLYNYFCNYNNTEDVIRIRKYIIIFASILISLAFPAKFVIEIYLTNYLEAINILFILFAAQLIYIIIKGIYVNLYKATKQQNKYFRKLFLILIIGAILNYLFVKIYPHKEAFAYGTLLSSCIWLVFSIYDFKKYKFTINELIYIGTEILAFIILGINFNSILGLIIYIIVTLVMMGILIRKESKELLEIAINSCKKSKNK